MNSSQAQQQFDMQTIMHNVNAVNQTTISDATAAEDKKYRKEWRTWCNQKEFHDGDLAYEEKLWLFIHETLVKSNADGTLEPRMQRPKGKSSIRTRSQPTKPIGN